MGRVFCPASSRLSENCVHEKLFVPLTRLRQMIEELFQEAVLGQLFLNPIEERHQLVLGGIPKTAKRRMHLAVCLHYLHGQKHTLKERLLMIVHFIFLFI
jgi:hypothetical protein